MRRAIIAVLALAGCSSQPVVQPIGTHQYVVIDGGTHVFEKAWETCTKLGRFALPMAAWAKIPREKRYKFECALPYEILPINSDGFTLLGVAKKGDYRMWVPTSEVQAEFRGSKHLPDPATDYCAKMNMTVKRTSGGFDLGVGLEVIFECVAPQQAGAKR